MYAYPSGRFDQSYSSAPPVLIAGSSESATARAARTVEAAGLRVGDQFPIDGAAARMDRQVAAAAIWVEIDGDCDAAGAALLQRVDRDVADGRYAAVVSAPASLIDVVAAQLETGAVELVVDGTESDRAAALALALAVLNEPVRVSDVAADRNAARLRHLSEEVNRIASTLARLSSGPAATPHAPAAIAGEDAPQVPAEVVRSVIRARRLRTRYFRDELFADPAWDMLLDLLQAEIAQLRVPVSSLCIAAAVPATTALRWLKTMTQEGLFVRRADPHDGRQQVVANPPWIAVVTRLVRTL